MVSGKVKNQRKTDEQTNELEKLLGAMLAPVAPRGEFVHHLQKQLESKFDPQPLLILPTKFINFIFIGTIGIIGGVLLTIFGIKWLKKSELNKKWRIKAISPGNENQADLQAS